MAKNPLGPDGSPMEGHHPGRLDGPTVLITKIEHDIIHQDERNAVSDILKKDNLVKKNGTNYHPGHWTGKTE